MAMEKNQKMIYLSRRQSDVVKLKGNFSEENFELALTIGHRLKGHGESFGFPVISSLGTTMESAAKERDENKLIEIIEKLDSNIEENIKLLKK